MSHINIIRAWKDEAYRQSLTPEERALLPENPAGLVDLNDPHLLGVDGGLRGTIGYGVCSGLWCQNATSDWSCSAAGL